MYIELLISRFLQKYLTTSYPYISLMALIIYIFSPGRRAYFDGGNYYNIIVITLVLDISIPDILVSDFRKAWQDY